MPGSDLRVPMAPILRAFGVSITVTRPAPNDDPIDATGVWMQPLEESQAFGKDFRRLEARKVMAIQKTASLSSLPRQTKILAPEFQGGVPLSWKVDGYESAVDPDLMRVRLVVMATQDT